MRLCKYSDSCPSARRALPPNPLTRNGSEDLAAHRRTGKEKVRVPPCISFLLKRPLLLLLDSIYPTTRRKAETDHRHDRKTAFSDQGRVQL